MSTPAPVMPRSEMAPPETEIQRIFRLQQGFAPSLRSTTAAQRVAKVSRLLDAFMAHQEQFQQAGSADYGKPAAEVDLTEIMPVVAEAKVVQRHLRKWMKPQGVLPTKAMLGTRSHIRYEPRGVCLIVAPWNYPANLTFIPLISAIAAGNTAMVKPSELAPHTSAVIAKIIRETFDEREVAVFEGDAKVAGALLELPFDHIFFTGSPQLGKIVMAAAAKHLTSVTLELGGKSPTIVDASADIKSSARSVVWAKYTNAGQTCIAPDYVLVHNDVKEAFLAECKKAVEDTYGDSPQRQMQSPDYARVVNQRHFIRVSGLLDEAVRGGARSVTGGSARAEDRFIAPTILTDVPPNSSIMEEEIFGPLLPVLGYGNIDQALAEVHKRSKPLALYFYGKNGKLADYVIENTTAGGTCVNGAVVHFLQHRLPFGGVNTSGIGSYHGHFGFKAFSHERAVVKVDVASIRMFYPPYTNFVRKLIKLAMRFFT